MKLFKKSLTIANIKIRLSCLILIITPLFFTCRGPEIKEIKNDVSANVVSSKPIGEKYVIDKKESVVMWKASMQFQVGGHTGYVDIAKGELMINNDQLVGGTVEMDMNTIADEKHGRDNNLVNHLKDTDFFDVKTFPNAAFVITKIEPGNSGNIKVSGLLTIKGIIQLIDFPARVEVKDGVVYADGTVTIDRTRWDVRYKSGKFYGTLADDTISDDVEFEVKIVAKK
jgi:polyisoprenoid-binding protein YceI